MAVFFNGIIRRRGLSVCAALLLVAGCGDDNNGGGPGPTPTPGAPQTTCPAAITVSNVTGSSQAVTYPAPTVTGGASPVTTTCDRASGSNFPLGTTPVNCETRDALQRTARCAFDVTLKGFSLSVKKFETFGDSLTAGETGRPNFVDTENSYPLRLQQSLDAYYPGQGMTVINRGENGNNVVETLEKILRYVPADRPEAVLILTGFNNLTVPCSPGMSATVACRNAIDAVGVGVLDCIRKTREVGPGVRYIFVSTLTPPGATGSNRVDANAIVQANDRIKQAVVAQGAVLSDAHAVFLGREAEYVNVDGLHLKPAGYQALADTFFAAIQRTVPQAPLLTFRPSW